MPVSLHGLLSVNFLGLSDAGFTVDYDQVRWDWSHVSGGGRQRRARARRHFLLYWLILILRILNRWYLSALPPAKGDVHHKIEEPRVVSDLQLRIAVCSIFLNA